ncbi:MAG TPA: outer membrane protein assembly factor BamD [Verrucomicrobiae bacterium]|nr:outer membrane protein assembly factor BamD [Verrucomicrobiae bacterium]
MMRWFLRGAIFVCCLAFLPVKTPAPLVYRPGEGWSWEPVGGAKWTRQRAKDQLDVAKEHFEKKDYRIARLAARRTVRTWPLSDYAPEAQFLVARTQEETGKDQKAFKAYQDLLLKYPKIDNYDEVLQRQFAIAEKYLAGKYFRFLTVFPYRSAEKTAGLFEKIVKNGPYSSVGPQAQMNIGQSYENPKGLFHDYVLAVKAYERAADRYSVNKKFASDAQFKVGETYLKQAKKAEYDQSVAGKAIAAFSDFATLYPDDPRVADAQKIITDLRTEQSRGSYAIARYYERKRRWDGALIYYNESVLKDQNSKFAEDARRRIELIKARKIAQAASNK